MLPVDPPVGQPRFQVGVVGGFRRSVCGVREELGHVEPDAAGSDDGHPVAHFGVASQDLDVRQHVVAVFPRNARAPRRHAGREHHLLERPVLGQDLGGHPGVQVDVDSEQLQPTREVAQRLVELLLARDALGHVELPADLRGRVEQRHLEAALGSDRGR